MACSTNEWAKQQMPKLRSQYGNQCAICGEQLHLDEKGRPNLQFAHSKSTGIRGSGRGRKERIADIRKHPQAYRLLCIDCHLETDALYREVHGTSVNNDKEN